MSGQAQKQQQSTELPQPPYRVDGKLKVTGQAKYSGEHNPPGLVHAYMVQSKIPNGKIVNIDTRNALKADGVIEVFTPANAPKLPDSGKAATRPPAGRTLSLLQDNDIHYNGQPIALVVARTLEQAQYAATLLDVQTKASLAKLEMEHHLADAAIPDGGKDASDSHRGDVSAGLAAAAVKVEQTYGTPLENHNPMEPHATIAIWDGDKLTLHDSTQYVSGVKQTIAKTLGIPNDNVRVECPFTGGGFGCKGSMWSHVVLCAMAARVVGHPVKLVLERTQMFGPVGARPQTIQKISLGAGRDGKLAAIRHDVFYSSSVMEDFMESSAVVTRMLYASEATATSHRQVKLNYGVGTFQRAPGESTGTAALEIAMDELAYKLKMDPVELRLVNYAERDQQEDKPFSSKHLRECYKQAAGRFGWSKRTPAPGSMKDGNKLIGWGMATATYPAQRMAAQALVRVNPDGTAVAESGTQDLGTGMYTIMSQTAGAVLGINPLKVEAKLGDTTYPKAPVSGGSMSAASVCPAVQDAAKQVRLKILQMAATDEQSPLHGALPDAIDAKDGRIFLKDDPSKGETYMAILARHGNKPVEAKGAAQKDQGAEAYSMHSFGAVFAEVAVDPDVRMVRVQRVCATYDIGTLLNTKQGINQLEGGIIWGISLALLEHTMVDPKYGRPVNENLAEYHVPVNLDIGDIDVTVLGIPDMKFNPMGARGIGEIGITGSAAAVANAIYHATGVRVRDYPITLDKLLG